MKFIETIFLDGMPRARLILDDEIQLVRFESLRDRLHELSLMTWSCPIQAREFITEFAREAGLGGVHHVR